MDTDELMSVKEAAESLGVTRAAVHKAINDGRLLTTVAAGKRFLVRSSVQVFKPRADAGRPRGKKQDAAQEEGGE